MMKKKKPVATDARVQIQMPNKATNTTILTSKRIIWISCAALVALFATLFTTGPPKIVPKPDFAPVLAFLDSVSGDIDLAEFFQGNSPPNITALFTNWMETLKKKLPPPPGSPASSDPEEFMPGIQLAKTEGVKAKHPVIIIPGITSTHLEGWSIAGKNGCGKKYFRKRIWGTMNMLRAMFLDKECWMDHMKLDNKTGLDPDGYKIRAVDGLDAADYMVGGYWVMGRIISNLAVIGYDSNNMKMLSYDWRLSFKNMEKRDRFFSRLKAVIEQTNKCDDLKECPKPVIVSHSMGGLLTHYFMQWVQSEKGGKGGKLWVDQHLHTWINIAGPLLGASKPLPFIVSGEVRDTVNLNRFAAYILDQFFTKKDLISLFRNWGGLKRLHPRGGEAIWGSESKVAPDDLNNTKKLGNIFEITGKSAAQRPAQLFSTPVPAIITKISGTTRNITASNLDSFLGELIGDETEKWNDLYDFSIATSQRQIDTAHDNPRTWANPLLSPLPTFKNSKSTFKVICEYGVGIKTDRKYYYSDFGSDLDTSPRYLINGDIHNPPEIMNGVLLGDGDATVPLISLGYMCAHGWRQKRYNPSQVKIITREHLNEVISKPIPDLRSGPRAGDHVDILGNFQVIEDILRVVSGMDQDIQDVYKSQILKISERVELPKF